MQPTNSTIYLSPAQLVERYNGNISLRNLERMRAIGVGPRWLKFQRKCMYSLRDVEAWEAENTFNSTAEQSRAA